MHALQVYIVAKFIHMIGSRMSDDITNDDLPKSKSQLKRESNALQALGGRLILLNNTQLDKLGLPTKLFQAIQEAKKITSRSATRRQLQYIGRLMRDIEDPTYIFEFIQKIEMKDEKATAFHHQLESWRERLLSEEEAITEFIELYPAIDRQHFRQLVMNARKEKTSGKPVGAAKLLFRYMRDLQLENKEKEES